MTRPDARISIMKTLRREITLEEFAAAPAVSVEATQRRLRKNASRMSDEEVTRYRNAVRSLVESGAYDSIVNIHSNAAYDMHGVNMGTGQPSPTGLQRFLSWHRAYLIEFENLLRGVDSQLTVPYWRWSSDRQFPSWLTDLVPQRLTDANGNLYDVEREIGVGGDLPERDDILARLDRSQYSPFTLALEGWQPYGAHNQVHVYVGGTMGTMYSPADPVFWLHHAECDRLWHIWQVNHPGEAPNLSGPLAVMSPWTRTASDLQDMSSLNYEYEEVVV